MMNKILTIIVPTYNMEKYLRKCLDSLIVSDENMEHLEVLVINDGSKDSSSQIAHEYETRYPQTFKVIDKENGNYGSCINRGLKEVTGKYIKVLDADDNFVAETFDKFINYLQGTGVDMVINDFVIVDEHDTVTETYTFDLPIDRTFTLQDIPKGINTWLWHQGITYKTDVLRTINYRQTEGISYTDDEWIFMPMVKVRSVMYFPNILYCYLLGREGQTFDPQVMKSSFDKRIAVGMSMVKYYVKVYDIMPADTKYYMTEKLIQKIAVIYHFYLAKEYSREGNELLKEFDLFVKHQSLYIYNLLGQGKDRFTGRNYIKGWRDSRYTDTWYLQVRRVVFKICVWMGREYRNLHMPAKLRRKLN